MGSSGRADGYAPTPAQAALMMDVLRQHPRPFITPKGAVAQRLVATDMLAARHDGYVLTRAGLDVAARLSAQRVIDAVHEKRSARAANPTPTSPGARADGAPAGWPFQTSAHDWSG